VSGRHGVQGGGEPKEKLQEHEGGKSEKKPRKSRGDGKSINEGKRTDLVNIVYRFSVPWTNFQ
jgi:hypothetical protein